MKIIWAVLVVLVVGGAIWYFFAGPGAWDYVYVCDGARDLFVRMQGESSVVIKSEAATIVREELDRDPSASGARYKNNDFVYWSQGTNATVWEDGSVILSGCETVLR